VLDCFRSKHSRDSTICAANILGSQLSASANLNPSQIANQPAFTYLGNNTSGTAAVTAVTAANLVSTVNPWIAAGGSADVITATYSPAITALTDGTPNSRSGRRLQILLAFLLSLLMGLLLIQLLA